ncbi:ATP-binding protein [Mycolicibacterium rhodesiae]|uniref:ATP-binding protein n=1 Tax=Mycolicibacterium rhodesiae TaxID=36814 RepID=UPI00031665FA|nr:adenylate/guanylate cyclase domain-containing protein [Mycolicibacterium rhodesiae]
MQVSAGDPPSGVVTFLFTDIEGSTHRWESDADAMRVALAAHDKVLRTAIDAHGGYVFSHSGDGIAAAFSSPMSAVGAAIDAQRDLQLPVRMGIATGEAELRDDDYFGTVLNRAARLMAAGHGGQVLVAESTAGLLSGVDLVDLGSRQLRDVPNPLNVFQVKCSGLRTDFPPLRTVDRTPGNLPRSSTAFVGREADVAEIVAALESRPMVTLTGVGGVGKTRLAMETAAYMSSQFADGVFYFELAAVTDENAVPDAVAGVLGITQQPGKSMTESIAAALEGRSRLLVFDNCEHVLDAAADLAEAILASADSVRIIATSREGLALAVEQVWPVRSLALDAAVQLFSERAHRVAPGAVLDDIDAVAEICRRLDGIPLAIELAASRMASMTAVEVRDHLDHRLKLLVGSRRALGRHQTLRHAVAWSYNLLDDAEKRLLERCSVFAGGFDLESACAVAGRPDADRYVIVDLLDALVRKSLIVVEHSSGRTRFAMLETIREFADEQLADRGDVAQARDAHARHFAGREADILDLWNSPRQREAYVWYMTELGNLRSAFRWAADSGDLDVAATIVTYLGILAYALENPEPTVWAEELMDSARAAAHPRLVGLYVVAALCWLTGRLEEAIAYTKAGTIAMQSPHRAVPFSSDGLFGGLYVSLGDVDRGISWYDTYLENHEDPIGIVRANRVLALAFAGRVDEAMAAAPDVVDVADASGNPYALSFALLAYGITFREADPEAALEGMRRGLVIAHESGARSNEAYLANNIGRLEASQGDMVAALDHLKLGIRINHSSGAIVALRSPLAILANILDRLQLHDQAAVIAGFAASELTAVVFPEFRDAVTRLREVLGDDRYEALARQGATMTTAAIATYALENVEDLRAALEPSP